jgi:hypothetical protein
MTLGSRAPLLANRTALVTSRRGHRPLLIRVSGFTRRGSMLLELLAFIRVTYARVWVRVMEGVGKTDINKTVEHVIIV